MNNLYAHHKGVDHGNAGGNGKGNGKNVPEIDGGGLPLAIVVIVGMYLIFKSLRKTI